MNVAASASYRCGLFLSKRRGALAITEQDMAVDRFVVRHLQLWTSRRWRAPDWKAIATDIAIVLADVVQHGEVARLVVEASSVNDKATAPLLELRHGQLLPTLVRFRFKPGQGLDDLVGDVAEQAALGRIEVEDAELPAEREALAAIALAVRDRPRPRYFARRSEAFAEQLTRETISRGGRYAP